MRIGKAAIMAICFAIAAVSCKNNTDNSGANEASSPPIDSTNVKGSAPAQYGGNNPANDTRDSNRTNTNDTGTKPNNIHNEGTYKR